MSGDVRESVLRKLEHSGNNVKKAMTDAIKLGVRPRVLFTIQLGQPVMSVELTERFVDDDDEAGNKYTDAENAAFNTLVNVIVYGSDLSVTEARLLARMQLEQIKKLGLFIEDKDTKDAD